MTILRHSKNSRKQGDVGLGEAIAYGTINGYTVMIPLTDNQSYDLCYDINNKICKISVKTTYCKPKNHYQVNLRVFGGNKSGQKVKKFDKNEIDYLFILCDDGSKYFIPSSDINSTTSLVLYSPWDKYKI